MDLLKTLAPDHLPHDLAINGSQSFYDKIDPEDYKLQFFPEHPYPVQSPFKCLDDSMVKSFLNNVQSDRQKKQAQREFRRLKNEICGQNFQEYAVLPNFFVEYMENKGNGMHNYGLNIPYSYGVLEKFSNQNEQCLIRPSIDNNLMIFQPRTPDEKITLQWLCPDPILHIQNMNSFHSNKFIVRGQNTIHLMEIDSNFHIKVDVKLNCDVGYVDTALNHVNKFELAVMDTKNKMKLFSLEVKRVVTSYTMAELNLVPKPRFIKFDYLTENMLMIMTDKQIKVLDTRCKDAPQDIELELEDCDMLLNFTLDKNENYLSDTVYVASKHSYFIYDIRMTNIQDFINHNLRSPPCFINYFQDTGTKVVTLFSQCPNNKAIFGKVSPYSLPYYLSSLEDTYNRCRAQRNVPVIPNIERRLNYPITGVQMVPNNGDISIYYTNIFGELFRQDILMQNSRSEEQIDHMYYWLTKIYEEDDPNLNAVHLANASAAFESKSEFNEIDLYNHYEKCNVHEFLEDEEFNFKNWNADAFLEVWNDHEEDMKTLLESETTMSKVEEWIENTKFEIDED